jgi:hypothetical protein
MNLTFAILGTGMAFIGLLGLYLAWRSHGAPRWHILGAWGGLIVSLICWSFAGGIDRGLALGAIVICLLALGFIAFTALSSEKGGRRGGLRRRSMPDRKGTVWGRFPQKIGFTLLAGPIAGLASYITAMGLHQALSMLGWHPANSLVMVLFIFPILWGVIATLVLISKRRSTFVSCLLGAPLVSAALIALGSAG